ncbi:hypothetical protein E2C01_075749 [Portunus trituberculatus]|uniref:Uncharacterized protein n=1 Tax=Portunus trituberculatus TaxID=210409 RepID=A0A5B7IGK3_PORTR|nr:hypothetical protein [Portunus trituberculatus]
MIRNASLPGITRPSRAPQAPPQSLHPLLANQALLMSTSDLFTPRPSVPPASSSPNIRPLPQRNPATFGHLYLKPPYPHPPPQVKEVHLGGN